MKKTRIAAAGVLVFAAVAAGWAVQKWKADGPGPDVVRTVAVERGDLVTTIQSTGTVLPQNRVDLRPPLAGRVEQVLAREGDRVLRGQVLAWLSSSERAALLDAARARGVDELRRWEGLYKATPLLAPIAGTVIARNVEPGQTVTASDAVLVLSDRLIVKAQVDETDMRRVRKGQEAGVILDAYPDERMEARVDHIAFEARTVSNVTVYEVDVLPARVPDFLRSGMTATVEFVEQRRSGVLLLPAGVIQGRGKDAAVLKQDPGHPGQSLRVEVVTGLSDGVRTEIKRGLEEGDLVLAGESGLPSAPDTGTSPFSPQRRRTATGGQRLPRGAR